MYEVLAHAAALAGLVALLFLPGYALERQLLREADLAGLRAPARAVLGIATWMLALFALACLGALRPAPLAAVSIAFAALAAGARLRQGPAAAAEPLGLPFLAAAGLATAPFWIGALDYRVAWDAGAYHLALPQRYVAAGGFTPIPLNVYAIWPHATELLFALALWLRDPALATALHAAFGALALWTAYLACRAAGRPLSGWIAAPLALANPVFLFELGVAYVDLVLAFFFSAGIVFLARALRSRVPELGALAIAGVCAGALAAVKLNGVLLAAAIAALSIPRAISLARSGEFRALRGSALAFGAPLAALWLPWVARSAWLTGDPFYPLLFSIFGGPDWSAALSAQFARWQRNIGMGRGALDYALLPLRVLLEGGQDYGHFAGRLGAHWLALIPLALAGARREPLARAALGASGLYFALWALGSQQLRFLVPILVPLGIAAGLALEHGANRIAALWPRARIRSLRAVATAVAIAPLCVFGRDHLAGAFASLDTLRLDAELRRAASSEPHWRWANAALPASARVLLLDTNQSFFLEREALADSFFEASQIADWLGSAQTPEQLHARLAQRGVTHLLRDRRRDWGIRWPPALLALLADPTHSALLYRSADARVEVFELESSAAEDRSGEQP